MINQCDCISCPKLVLPYYQIHEKRHTMSSYRKVSIAYGILLVSGIAFGIFSSVPVLEEPGYLAVLSSIKARVMIAVAAQCAMAITYTLIAALLYPVVRKHDEAAATAYFGFRIIGAAFLYVGIVTLLALLFISESYLAAGGPASSHFQTTGELLRVTRDWFNHVGMILPWSAGGLILYYSFFRMNLVPKWLSIWGLAGSALTMIATFLLLFDIIKIVTTAYFALNAPSALFEVTLAVFLFVKGFGTAADQSSVRE